MNRISVLCHRCRKYNFIRDVPIWEGAYFVTTCCNKYLVKRIKYYTVRIKYDIVRINTKQDLIKCLKSNNWRVSWQAYFPD